MSDFIAKCCGGFPELLKGEDEITIRCPDCRSKMSVYFSPEVSSIQDKLAELIARWNAR